tara:strand:- start:379 stop:1095 length:717 start_codon:yes stop_codon:yes gene_type:complete
LKLIIDIGNTSTKLTLFKGKKIIQQANIQKCDLTSIKDFIGSEVITSSILSSSKEIDVEILKIIKNYNGIILTDKIKTPIINKYKTKKSLGQDRLAAVTAAAYLYPKKDVLVFDAGTCLTIDFINSKKEYLGGRISPGIHMRFKALHTFTEKLPLLSQERLVDNIGNDTDSSIISGVYQGIFSEVRDIISEYKLINPDTVILFTGGDCFSFEKELKSSIFANANLVAIGLNEILDYDK